MEDFTMIIISGAERTDIAPRDEAGNCTLRDVLESYNDSPKDVDLYHWDYDLEFATMVDCSMNMFTAEGLKKFDKILNAKVEKVYEERSKYISNWVSVYVTGINYHKVEELALSQAGYCSVEDYEKWFREDE
jgi:hypothetical protein